MPALITTSDACYQALTDKGQGMLSQWTLTGSPTTYTGVVPNTDGYQITFTMQWRDMTNENETSTGATATNPAFGVGDTAVVGTCVETLDSNGAVLAAGTDTEGNFAVCHWFYLVVGGNVTSIKRFGTAGTDYSEVRYYNEVEWGTIGSGINGANTPTKGQAIGVNQGYSRFPATATSYTIGDYYSQSWYQPKYATTYAAGALRRYNGASGSRDKVRAYCMGIKSTSL